MAKLIVSHHGQEIAQLVLEEGHDYIIGRGTDCAIQLPNERGISRQHLKIGFEEGQWSAELLSKTGELILDGESVGGIGLVADCQFSIPPFQFEFQMADAPAEAEEEAPTNDAAEATQTPEAPEDSEPSAVIEEDLDEQTESGIVSLLPILKIKNTKTNESFSLKLDGQVWVAGRHPDCEIHIDDNAISRRHFELTVMGNLFYIKDLGSSNGTSLNGNDLEQDEAVEISSGDVLSIRHLEIEFEVRNPKYEEQLKRIENLPAVQESVESSYGGPAVIKMDPAEDLAFLQQPKVKKALMFGAPGLLVLALIFGGGKGEEATLNSEDGKGQVTSTADLKEAKHLLEVAKNHYFNRNYSFCLTQLEKLHQLVPSYEDSKELEGLCQQAIELENINKDLQAKEEQKRKVEEKIRAIVANCASTKTEATTALEMRNCLSGALELNPENGEALALIEEIENREQQKLLNEQQKQAELARKRAGRGIFNSAVQSEKSGRLRAAIGKYRSFLSGRYGLSSEESRARRSIASISKRLDSEIRKTVQACQKLVSEQKYREAIDKCDEALRIDAGNDLAKSAKEKVYKKLRVDMKKIWDTSVLEENYGNIEAAKQRWTEITTKSIPGENFYKKAKSKLRQYGIE